MGSILLVAMMPVTRAGPLFPLRLLSLLAEVVGKKLHHTVTISFMGKHCEGLVENVPLSLPDGER